jgi:hypothetical protein
MQRTSFADVCSVVTFAMVVGVVPRAAAQAAEPASYVTATPKVAASDAPPTVNGSELQEDRTLAGHMFVPLVSVVSPFLTTSLASSTTAGIGWFTLPAEQARFVEPDGAFAMFLQTFIGRVSATRWLGFELKLGGAVLGGKDVTGSLVVGINQAVGGTGRVLFCFVRGDAFQVSGSVDGGLDRIEALVPRRILDSLTVVDGRPSFTRDIVTSGWQGRGGGSLMGAVALAPWAGLQLSASGRARHIDVDDSVEGDAVTQGRVEGAIGVAFDLGPIAVVAAGGAVHDFTGDADSIDVVAVQPLSPTSGLVEGGLHLQYPEPLDVGMTFLGAFGDGDTRAGANLQLGYYW